MNTYSKIKEANLLQSLEQECGPLIQRCPNSGKISGLNPLFTAHLLSHKLLIRFCTKKESFIVYDEELGIWDYISNTKNHEKLWAEIYTGIKVNPSGEPLSKYVTSSFVSTVQKLLKGICEQDLSDQPEDYRYFHATNCMLVFDIQKGTWEQKGFSSDFFSLYRSKITYEPAKECPRFIEELLRPAMTKDDIQTLQLYLGQCLLTTNFSQMFLLLIGTAGGGKSTLVNIIEKIIGKEHCAELRAGHTTGRFEIGSLIGKKLLTGKDVSSQFMNNSGARSLKILTGNDTVTGEYKGSNTRKNIEGNFNIIITSNNTLRLKFDGDLEAWRRRILIVNYQSAPPKKKIANFDDVLIKEEGSGILNWIMEGAVKLIQSESVISKSERQKASVDDLLNSSDPVAYFGDLFIHRVNQSDISSSEVLEIFTKFCHQKKWELPSDREIQTRLKLYMTEKHGACQSNSIKRDSKSKRGYRNFQITNSPEK
jgi:putative DNA primase/helicase